jgi:hypothetical protein
MRPVCKDFICFHMGTRSTKKVLLSLAGRAAGSRAMLKVEATQGKKMEDGQCLVNR